MKITQKIFTSILIIISLTTVLLLSGCTTDPATEDTSTIVTSLSLIGNIIEELVGTDSEYVVKSIVEGLEDPHTYEPLPSEVEAVTEADLFIQLGVPGLEPWAPTIVEANPGINTLTLVDYDAHEYMDIDPLTQSYNGHVWLSPLNMKDMVQKITDELVTIDKANQAVYETNLDSYTAQLDQLLVDINTTKNEVTNGIKVVVNHPAFMYLLDLLGIERMGIIEESHGSEPSAEHIDEIIDIITTEDIPYIIVQPQVESSNIDTILAETNAELIELTPLTGVDGVSTYLDLIQYNLEVLETAISSS